MSICSLVVYTRPENVDSVGDSLALLEGVEVHARGENGKLVVTIDHPERRFCSDTMMHMSTMDGVINTALIYEYFEEDDIEPGLEHEPVCSSCEPDLMEVSR